MENTRNLKVLLVADGSGGHLIPALQVAGQLQQEGVQVKLWYAGRPQVAPLTRLLTDRLQARSIEIDAIPVSARAGLLTRCWQSGRLWSKSRRCFDAFGPDVVIGFGGWISAPVLFAARQRGIRCLVHEQNVQLGRANRMLARWVDRVAISFRETASSLNGTPSVWTGLPLRPEIGSAAREDAARHVGFDPSRPTILALGGSQGSRAINQLMVGMLHGLTPEECHRWQVLHIAGGADAPMIRTAYASRRLRAHVVPFLAEMDLAYAQADVVVSRAGASTIAELARCGIPAILIPYPHARAHQQANAKAVESAGGAVILEEAEATPQRLLALIRPLIGDPERRRAMAERMRTLAVPDATQRLAATITQTR
jgi:UDP-N-acetylglucosamine--N-acetylmuramyl-(pentapeptide) pyrophosphoryl-undecaprenol N-acetylglucosamine transferase